MNLPTLAGLTAELDVETVGRRLHALVAELYRVPRSLTGDGVRQTLATLGERLGSAGGELAVHEVPTGTPVLDWTIPKEWNLRRAWIKGPDGQRVVDTADHNLHVVGYSVPVNRRLSRAELDEHLCSLPERPDWTPYRTSYYRETWGFCLPHRVRESLPEGEYQVVVDATLADGALSYGELALPGESTAEILLSCHICHPQLANDNLSALAVTAVLAELLAALPHRRYGYRFVWAPGTIGAITWLARNEAKVTAIRHGLVLANLGDAGGFHYKRSRRGDAVVDRAVEQVLADRAAGGGERYGIEDFVPFGYDERQYCSPGFDLPVGLLSRTPWGRFPEYHTSADDLDLVRPEALAGSLRLLLEVLATLESNRRYRNLAPKCEPQLGRHGLYRTIGGGEDGRERELALLWVLNQSDGQHDLLAISRRSGLRYEQIRAAAAALQAADLLAPLAD
jgi:aminopeptidase-like protein